MKKPKRERFELYWKFRPIDNYASKREASYWFQQGRLAEQRDLNRIWEFKRNKAETPKSLEE